MRRVGVITNVPAPKGLAELNHHNPVDLKEGRNGPPFDGQWMSEEDELRIIENVNTIRPNQLGQAHASLHRQEQQSHRPVVQWESFLPVRSLKVLLVESDDSTRHVVSALLRNCSYEVTAVANSLEAWKLLTDLNKQIDLVLTEVVMPYLSGIGLLSKIMNHVTRKNIPVIMMSSEDSMGIVFNCLSKGAVDFLVKPIRKNELKNLWQHVWRKCHSSSGSGSGSGSESGIRDHKSTKSRSIEESEGDGENRNEDENVSIELNAKGGSDNGSGTQSCWPKKVVEVDSSNPHDITSAQVARPDTSKIEIIEMGRDLEIGVPKSSSFEVEDTNKKMDKKVGDKIDISMQLGCETGASRTEPLNAHQETLKANNLLKNINIEVNYSKESHALELTLKRPIDVEDADVNAQERNFLRQSGHSAFSSCSPPPDISSEEVAKPNNILSNSNGTPNHRSNGSDYLWSTTTDAFTTKPDDKALPNNSTIVVHNHHTSTLQPLIPSANKDDPVKTTVAQPKAPVQQQVQVRHHHYHHHHHHVHKLQQQKVSNPDDGSLRNIVSNILTASTEGNAANYGSGSGSNIKSNGENGGSWQKGNGSVPVIEGGNIEKGNGGRIVFNGGDGSGSASGVDRERERLAQREAALNKFRQKRKERCFEKKVRYQSRKKLAEQRPRIRGQFVRHGAKGVNNEDADS
ncbi:two-component response regulator-like APRR3 isoform X2 [Bidens hawaiensis]|uniref:two-component response regulator-like APRR3 isoform X2 n=1 Tax=Bidens hawaiensis TaxID=980011 RepID=UPI00404B0747